MVPRGWLVAWVFLSTTAAAVGACADGDPPHLAPDDAGVRCAASINSHEYVYEPRARALDLDAFQAALRALVRAVEVQRSPSDPWAETAPLLRGLARLGPAAAPVVPALCVELPQIRPHTLGSRPSLPNEGYDTRIAASLVGVGPAARKALPDLKLVVARVGDADGTLRAALHPISEAR